MNLDTFANVADIVSIPISIVGLILVLHQLYLTRLKSEKEHLRMKNEMTLNAYSTVRKDLREITSKVRNKLNINDMFDNLTDEQIKMIMNDKNLKHDVEEMLSLLNKFAVGVKHDIFNINIINELSGKYFIKTHKQFAPYIKIVRENSNTIYYEYDILVKKLKIMRSYTTISKASKEENKTIIIKLRKLLLSNSTRMIETLTIVGIFIMFLAVGGVYLNNIHSLPTPLLKVIIGLFVTTVVLIIIQLFYALKKYLELHHKQKELKS